MNDRNQTKKVRTVTYIYLICLLVLIGLYPACSIEEQPPAMLEIHAAGVSQSREGRILQAVISDPETCTSLGSDSQELVYDEDREVFTCSLIEPEDGDYVIVVKDLDGECFGAVPSADIENGQLFVPLRQRYAPGQLGPAGGVIFMEFPLVTYLETGKRYLEAYPTDSVSTSLLLTHAEASSYCDDAEISGQTDWFLPDVSQLEALEEQVSASVQGDPPYWSSEKTEGIDRFLLYYMKDRIVISDSGVTKYPAWPVRSF